MKLALLVVVAAVVAVPHLSEGRTVSKCELKEKLENAITMPRWWSRWRRDRYLARVVCSVYSLSRLKTDVVRLFGQRRTTTTAAARTTRPPMPESTRPPMPETTRPPVPESTRPPVPESTRPPVPESTRPPMPESTRPPMPESTRPPVPESTRPPMPESTRPMVNESATIQMTTPIIITLSPGPDSTSNTMEMSNGRKKRDVVSTSSEEYRSLEDMLDEDGQQGDDSGDEDNSDDDHDEEDESGEDSEGDEEDEGELVQAGGRKKRSLRRHRRWRWPIGFYGIFQLSDRYFCDSGEYWSRNVCNTSCQAFTDDDITDDVQCIVRTRYYRRLARRGPRWCRRIRPSIFHNCP